MNTIHYERRPELDKRIKNGDDFAGDAYVRWVAVGQVPDGDFARSAVDRLRESNAELAAALELGYLLALTLPHDALRARNQAALAAMRDAIANTTKREPQEVQDEFEERALRLRLSAGYAKVSS